MKTIAAACRSEHEIHRPCQDLWSGRGTARYPECGGGWMGQRRNVGRLIRNPVHQTNKYNEKRRNVSSATPRLSSTETATRMAGSGIAGRAGLDGDLRLDGHDPFVLEQFGG